VPNKARPLTRDDLSPHRAKERVQLIAGAARTQSQTLLELQVLTQLARKDPSKQQAYAIKGVLLDGPRPASRDFKNLTMAPSINTPIDTEDGSH
jgi:hypothetical protein